VREDRLGVIAALITDRALCASCITSKASVASGELPAYLGWIGTGFTVQDEIDRCRACDGLTTVFSLMRRYPSSPESGSL
jgi:hypothetical protein